MKKDEYGLESHPLSLLFTWLKEEESILDMGNVTTNKTVFLVLSDIYTKNIQKKNGWGKQF